MQKKQKKVAGREERRALFQAMVEDLVRERDELRARLTVVESELADYGALPAAPRRRAAGDHTRPLRAGSLKAHVARAVGAGAGSIEAITEAVLEAGYESRSKSLRQTVALACSELTRQGVLVRKSRGHYSAA